MAVESSFRHRVVDLLRGYGFFVQAVESAGVNPGMPDVYYRKGVAGWFELKQVKKLPSRPDTSLFKSYNHPLLTEQCNWILLEIAAGGKADILVGYGREYFLVPGELAPQFNDFTEARLRKFRVEKNDIIRRAIEP